MDKALVSIIVLVYNMQDSVRKCIDSILKQSYASIELIIVDDGSTDNSGSIANEYQEKHNNVKVIRHEVNKGIACGFISGISEARGSYIAFVDSDNYIDEKMIEKLLSIVEETSADIVQGEAYCYLHEEDIDKLEKSTLREPIIEKTMEGKEEIIEDYLNEETITNNLAAKVFKKELFEGVIIPEGHQVVDATTLMQLINNSNRYVCIKDVVYYAYQAPNSISRSAISERRLNDLIFSNDFTNDFISNNWQKWNDYIHYRCVRTGCWAYNQIYLSDLAQREQRLATFKTIFADHYKEAKRTKYFEKVSSKDRSKYYLLYHFPCIYNAILKIRFR